MRLSGIMSCSLLQSLAQHSPAWSTGIHVNWPPSSSAAYDVQTYPVQTFTTVVFQEKEICYMCRESENGLKVSKLNTSQMDARGLCVRLRLIQN